MRKPRALILIEYWLVKALFALFRSLPIPTALFTARALGVVAWLVDARHRRVAMENARHAFGSGMTLSQRRRLVRRVFEHFAMVLAEVIFFPRYVRRTTFARYLRLLVHPEVDRVLRERKPAVFVAAHMGNWEVFGAACGIYGVRFHSVARPLDNPLLDIELVRHRGRYGQIIVPKEGALKALARVLKDGGPVMLVVDQAAGSDGVWVDFFGRKCSTQKSVAFLALRYNAPIFPGYTWRHPGRFFHTAILDAPLTWERSADRDEDALRATQAYTSRLEAFVRRHPEQWLWLHNRWKRYAGVSVPGEDAPSAPQ